MLKVFLLLCLLIAAVLAPPRGRRSPSTRGAAGLDVQIERIDISKFPLIFTYLSVIDPIGKP